MQTVKVNVEDLLAILRNNRENHRTIFNSAVDVYAKRVEEWLEDKLKRIRNGEKVDVMISFPEPEDFTEEYDTVIRMLEMSVDEEIVISRQDFNMYVMDRWHWHERFAANTTSYLANG